MDIKYGSLIKDARIKKGVSQKQLSDNICSQGLISQIEMNQTIPTVDIFLKIASKLEINLDVLTSKKVEFDDQYYFSEFIFLVNKAKRDRNYREIQLILNDEESNIMKKGRDQVKQFFYWHKGICFFHLYDDFIKAIMYYKKALGITGSSIGQEYFIGLELEILISIGITYSAIKNQPKAIHLFKKVSNSLSKSSDINNNKKLELKLLYNLSKAHGLNKDFCLALKYAKKGRNICISHGYLYLLGEFNYQIGINLIETKEIEKGVEYLEQAITVFDIEGKKVMSEFVNNKIEKLE
ncbi:MULTISPECIES: helix-turn-helix domain-containing protein [Bacillaceae]|uniref:Helix-turn-helix transcriptional regulator n=1 Tax=Evansella alkalicola TaxID=745819 RepID=A0ABS6JYS9_9BACI|nr:MULTISPECIES: helix-turn-helix domain-containing protein [Bacillaceae]MBU9723241.1 helix-turn-helix transcriptional regulator [Bacillus alkalicola]